MAKRLTILCLILLFSSCQSQFLAPSQHSLKPKKSPSQTASWASHHSPSGESRASQITYLLQNNVGKSGIQVTPNDTYELLLKNCPKKAKQLLISVSIVSSNYTDTGYLAMKDRTGNLGVGIDFSWTSIHRYKNGSKFIKGMNDQVILNILIDQVNRSYALLAQNNGAKEVFRTTSQPFLHPAFSGPSKLEFAVKGNFTIEQVAIRNI